MGSRASAASGPSEIRGLSREEPVETTRPAAARGSASTPWLSWPLLGTSDLPPVFSCMWGEKSKVAAPGTWSSSLERLAWGRRLSLARFSRRVSSYLPREARLAWTGLRGTQRGRRCCRRGMEGQIELVMTISIF